MEAAGRLIALAALVILAACGGSPGASSAASEQESGGPLVPGTDIPLPADYSPDGRAHYAMRVAFFAEHPPEPGAVAMVGDSITEGGDWGRLISGVRTANFGVSYDRTSGLLARLGQLEKAEPSKILLLIGANDVGNFVPNAEIAANLRAILRRMKEFVPADRILLQSVMPREPEFEATIVGLNRAVAAIAAEEGVAYLDIYPSLVDGGRLNPALTDDSLHLNEAGYAVWSGLIAGWAAE